MVCTYLANQAQLAFALTIDKICLFGSSKISQEYTVLYFVMDVIDCVGALVLICICMCMDFGLLNFHTL